VSFYSAEDDGNQSMNEWDPDAMYRLARNRVSSVIAQSFNLQLIVQPRVNTWYDSLIRETTMQPGRVW
jgi:hypothetical protein